MNRTTCCKIFINFFLITLLISCKSKVKKRVASASEMSFKIVDSLLGYKYSDTVNGFQIRMPKEYDFFELSNQQKNELSKLNIVSISQARLKSAGSIFILLNLNNLSDSLFFDYNHKLETFTKSNTSNSIDSFYSNNLFFKQYIVKSNNTVQLKVIISNRFKGHHEINFQIPLDKYNLQSTTVESVLGSIN